MKIGRSSELAFGALFVFIVFYIIALLGSLIHGDFLDVLKVVTPALTVIVSVATLLIGWKKYQERKIFEVGFQSDFSKHVLVKRLEFYERFSIVLRKIEVFIWRNGAPSGEEARSGFFELLQELRVVIDDFGIWLPKTDQEVVDSIFQKHLGLQRASHLFESYSQRYREPSDEAKRIKALDEMYVSLEQLLTAKKGMLNSEMI
ncbi:MAG: hypothetical protein WAT81_03090 [Candidatus Moraniibacteriota bacterium]